MSSRLLDAAYLLPLGALWLKERFVRGKKTAPLAPRWRGFPEIEMDPARPVIWVHGVSVGEVMAARSLVAELEALRPELRFVVTSTSLAGLERARDLYPRAVVSPSPLDFSRAIRRAHRAFRPAMMIFVEGDLWPNWLKALTDARVPVVVVNGKLSERSAKRYRWGGSWLRSLFRGVRVFCVQNERYRARWEALGLDSDRVIVSGNLKVDNLPAADDTLAGPIREAWNWPSGRTWLAGSTHEGEERVVLSCHRRLLADRPDLKLVVAPRHLERIDAVESEAVAAGLSVRRWSAGPGDNAASVILIDTMGDLAGLFSAVDLVFLGGSLVPVGGHNLLEPANAEKALLFGPRVETVREIADELIGAGAARQVKGEESLEAAVAMWLDDEEARREAGRKARSVVDRARGASKRTARVLVDLMNE